MTDILRRLHCTIRCDIETAESGCHCAEGRDTITALRAEVERLKVENEAVLSANRDVMLHWDVLKADYEKLRAALWDIHAVCNNWDWFIWMWPIRRIKRIARAALEEKQ